MRECGVRNYGQIAGGAKTELREWQMTNGTVVKNGFYGQCEKNVN
jgi:hypothetical protein